MRRWLTDAEIAAALCRGCSVEQFIGASPAAHGYIRVLRLVTCDAGVELWLNDLEDIGSDAFLDIFEFPTLNADPPSEPVFVVRTTALAVDRAQSLFGANPQRWVNQHVAASDYEGYLRAGRPNPWLRAD